VVVGVTECCGLAVADISIAAVALVVIIPSDDPLIGTDAVIAIGTFPPTLDIIPMTLSVTLPVTAASLLAAVVVVVTSFSSLMRFFAGSTVVILISSALLTTIVEATESIDDDFG